MILYGQPVADKIYSQLKLANHPSIAVVLVGEDSTSLAYTRVKEKRASQLGINFKLFHLPGIAREQQILKIIDDLNKNKHIDGIVIQLPLPEGIDTEEALKTITPEKDIDGFYSEFVPPPAQAILEILQFYKMPLKGKKIVIVGYGRLVGKPLVKLLAKKGIKPIICTSNTGDLAGETLEADIIISATGVSGIIRTDMVSENAIVIDAGTAESKGEIRGDVDPTVYEKVRAYTPTPGGVGPVTVACLMRNLVQAAQE